MKDFNLWNESKKQLDSMTGEVFAHPREIWWCSLGLNIGAEVNGKNDNFERPVLVLRVYNTDTMLVLPITTKSKDDKFHYKISLNQDASSVKTVYAKLTQLRVISNKRLLRKVNILDKELFEDLKIHLKKFV